MRRDAAGPGHGLFELRRKPEEHGLVADARAVNIRPIGRPSSVQCSGSDIDGCPVTFAIIVYGAASKTGVERLEDLGALAQQRGARQRT